MPTAEEYEEQIASLKEELARLKSGVNSLMTLGGGATVAQDQRFTIQGLEEMIMVVAKDGRITYVNDRMATLLGVPSTERNRVLGKTLAEMSPDPLADVLDSIRGAVSGSGEDYVAEREFPDLGPERLPSLAERRVQDVPLLRFSCSLVKDKVQIVAQDVTHTNWLYKNFSRFVSPRVIEQMQTIPEDELMKTEKKEVTVLFADLSGFTSACQRLTPDEVVDMVNSFLTNAVNAVDRYEGMVDKFVGDEIMAVFGVPLSCPDHGIRALLAASDIKKRHDEWVKTRREQGLVAPGVHIGIASGEVVVGNIGTTQRLDYTVLGHVVNIASRLCDEARDGDILTVRSTHQAAKEGLSHYTGDEVIPRFHFEVRGSIELKNVHEPVEIITVSTREPE
ncbi:MAG: adenylate/guanylate cyclase domain-containing protein [bacterium]